MWDPPYVEMEANFQWKNRNNSLDERSTQAKRQQQRKERKRSTELTTKLLGASYRLGLTQTTPSMKWNGWMKFAYWQVFISKKKKKSSLEARARQGGKWADKFMQWEYFKMLIKSLVMSINNQVVTSTCMLVQWREENSTIPRASPTFACEHQQVNSEAERPSTIK